MTFSILRFRSKTNTIEQSRPESFNGIALDVRLVIYHDTRKGLTLVAAHDASLVEVHPESAFKDRGGDPDYESLAMSIAKLRPRKR